MKNYLNLENPITRKFVDPYTNGDYLIFTKLLTLRDFKIVIFLSIQL